MNKIISDDIQFLTITGACRNYGIGRTYCYKLLSEKKIKAKKLGGKTLISVHSMKNYFASLPDYVPGAVG